MASCDQAAPHLGIMDWGAVRFSDEGDSLEGAMAPEAAVPARLRRRLGRFERGIVQAIVGLGGEAGAAHVTLGSRFGSLAASAGIFDALFRDEPPSPTLFSHSVLNAGCGVANQARRDRTAHTAISAGERTLHSTLTEAWLHLPEAHGACHIVVLIDTPPPDIYAPITPRWQAGLCVAMKIDTDGTGTSLPHAGRALGSEGYEVLLNELRAGCRRLCLSDIHWCADKERDGETGGPAG